MKDISKATATAAAITLGAGFIALTGAVVLMNGYVLHLAWNMILPAALGLPKISIAGGVGINAISILFKPLPTPSEIGETAPWSVLLTKAFGIPAMVLLIAYIASQFLGGAA